ncbi:hypothetical protein GLOTRDRAFT_138062 [Gloeophyllum trabeum ATCC 11539]|uniref:Oxidase ustYa n=1 Tax=Gloeophyllum trabeum (strain ATCC 11539 / FP-39264 / Madison 617) TaxID=670483 RepID=S7Q8H6_GLOTA|nr:uncharacterized protein GLOTRDRAFT_138062 [Gloeophyllum trabeum ATCC 11539]EPQ56286.1 hypothetical protein GLOTRDRAFT_138062 [Gloeophyllum trabeum ATCC 11539]
MSLSTTSLEDNGRQENRRDYGTAQLVWLGALVVLTNLLVFRFKMGNMADAWFTSFYSYDYAADDFPESYPIGPLPEAQLIIEDTVHYQINTEDADEHWASMFPSGGGFVHLGPHYRAFGISMFHQLACLNDIRQTLATPLADRTAAQLESNHRCFNYLRQTLLCEPELRLEPESDKLNELGLNEVVDGLGMKHSCRDWTVVYEAMESNYNDTKEHDQSVHTFILP